LLNNDVAKENRVSFTELHKLGDLRGGSVDYLPGVAYQSRWHKKIDDYEIVGERIDCSRKIEAREGVWEDALPEGLTGVGVDDFTVLLATRMRMRRWMRIYFAAEHGLDVVGDGRTKAKSKLH
jgi:hypothetical protein